MTDLVRCGVGVAVEQFLGHQNEPRRAKAALECAVLDKGLLDRMELVAGAESLDNSQQLSGVSSTPSPSNRDPPSIVDQLVDVALEVGERGSELLSSRFTHTLL